MSKINSLLNLRLRQKKPKLKALAELSQKGDLSGFSGIFQITNLKESEKTEIFEILKKFQIHKNIDIDIDKDHNDLIKLSSEVKAITNQAIILHGERIKKAQNILKNYKDGAFSSWLIATYGNRQTPYNFLQYFELYSSMPPLLKEKMYTMPRQAIYSLASRNGETTEKEKIIKGYKGETKKELLLIIRKNFPLDRDDKRLPNLANQVIASFSGLEDLLDHILFSPSEKQKIAIYKSLDNIYTKMQKH